MSLRTNQCCLLQLLIYFFPGWYLLIKWKMGKPEKEKIRETWSACIVAMIFNLSKYFSIKFAKTMFPKHKCKNKVYQIATVNFRWKKLVILILKLVLKICLLKDITCISKSWNIYTVLFLCHNITYYFCL